MAKRGQSKGLSSSKSGRHRTRVLAAEPAKAFDKKQSRINALNTSRDAFGGDEDEFHRQRDSIGFGSDDEHNDDDDDMSDLDVPDEVYGLNLPQQQSDDDTDEHDATRDESDDDDAPVNQRKQFKRKAQDNNRGRFAKEQAVEDDDLEDEDGSEDDERDQAQPDQDGDNDGSSEAKESDSDDDDDERWAAHQYRVSRRAPGEADSEDDEALELEAEEALRLQKKAKSLLAADDYGLGGGTQDGDDDAANERDANDVKSVRGRKIEDEQDDDNVPAGSTHHHQQHELQDLSSKEQAVAYLLKHNPETLALLDDFTAAAERVKQVELNLVQVRQGIDGKEHPALGIMELEHQAITTYLHTLGFYFSILLTSSPSKQLVDKVLSRLSSLRQALATMEELDLTSEKYEQAQDDDDESEEDDDDDDESPEEEENGMLASDVWDAGGAHQVWSDDDQVDAIEGEDDDESEDDDAEEDEDDEEEDQDSMLHGLSDDELAEIMAGMPKNAGMEEFIRRVAERRAEKELQVGGSSRFDDDDAMDEEDVPVMSSKAAKKERKRASKELVVPELAPISRASLKPTVHRKLKSSSVVDDYVEPTSLSMADEADKRSARHSLRFHVSQVNQKAQKRQQLTKAVGGDDDVPRRSKENARREVLKRQQHGASSSAAGSALDDQDYDEEDLRAAKRVKGLSEGDDDVGDLVDELKRKKDAAKLAKKQLYDESRLAEKNEIMDLASSMPDGPRGATRQILANKGLTPRRKKENRNARVKKRLQYDKAKKKLGSVKSVYKGGLGGSSYEGEKTGIGKQVVKSRKL
ncbi:hypothetical protein ACM66B_006780 [Microbotryomycetes sp. NB124-2]